MIRITLKHSFIPAGKTVVVNEADTLGSVFSANGLEVGRGVINIDGRPTNPGVEALPLVALGVTNGSTITCIAKQDNA